MSNETVVTIQGHVGGDVRLNQAGGSPVANFRVACTPRRRTKNGEWFDGPVQWYSVSAWRQLAEHCAESLHRGDPVVVHGRLDMKPWRRDGVDTVDVAVEAWTVGHDLTRGSSSFTRHRPADTQVVPQPQPHQVAPPEWGVPGSGSGSGSDGGSGVTPVAEPAAAAPPETVPATVSAA